MQPNSMISVARFIATLTMTCLHTILCFGQDDQLPSTKAGSDASKTSIIRIMVQPMIYNPARWKIGERITVKVQCESDNKTRVIGIATDVELVATKTYDNRWEMMLRSSRENIAKIRSAAKLSEYWFTVTPFIEKHRKLVAEEPEINEFLGKNKEYRPADGTNWGLNANSKERLRIPTEDELPSRAK